jgi:hypothetical protein
MNVLFLARRHEREQLAPLRAGAKTMIRFHGKFAWTALLVFAFSATPLRHNSPASFQPDPCRVLAMIL